MSYNEYRRKLIAYYNNIATIEDRIDQIASKYGLNIKSSVYIKDSNLPIIFPILHRDQKYHVGVLVAPNTNATGSSTDSSDVYNTVTKLNGAVTTDRTSMTLYPYLSVTGQDVDFNPILYSTSSTTNAQMYGYRSNKITILYAMVNKWVSVNTKNDNYWLYLYSGEAGDNESIGTSVTNGLPIFVVPYYNTDAYAAFVGVVDSSGLTDDAVNGGVIKPSGAVSSVFLSPLFQTTKYMVVFGSDTSPEVRASSSRLYNANKMSSALAEIYTLLEEEYNKLNPTT